MKELIKKIDREKLAECFFYFWVIKLICMLVCTFRYHLGTQLQMPRFCMAICILLLFSLAADKPLTARTRALMRLTIALAVCQFMTIESMAYVSVNPALGNKMEVIMLALDEVVIFCFWRYIVKELDLHTAGYRVMNVVCIISAAFGIFFDLANYCLGYSLVKEGDAFSRTVWGAGGWMSNLGNVIICMMIVLAIVTSGKLKMKNKFELMTFVIPPVAAFAYVGTAGRDIVFSAYTFSLLLIFINFYLSRGRQFLEQQVTLEKQSTALMISQIQPHFLYNTLTTISNLCATDPEQAEETTVLFAQYLRANLDSLKSEEPVPFKSELAHIETYVEIEKKRFGDRLNIEFDVEDTDFCVPSLGLQPIIENSIKHGIRGKDTPGHLKMSCLKEGDGHRVIIEDDGVGFDAENLKLDDGRTHVGMENVKNRLEKMCNATMKVDSRPGCGCRTSIYFPRCA